MDCFLKIFICELKIHFLFFQVSFLILFIRLRLLDQAVSYLIERLPLPLLNLIIFKSLHHTFFFRWTCCK